MRLCALLRVPSRRQLMRMLTYQDLREWRELYACDPWTEDRADLRAGQIASAVLAPHCKNPPAPGDFMLYAKKDAVDSGQTESEQKAIFRAAKRAFEKAKK